MAGRNPDPAHHLDYASALTESNLRTAGILEPPSPSWHGLLETPLRLTRACLGLLSGQLLDAGAYRFVPAQPPKRAVVFVGKQ